MTSLKIGDKVPAFSVSDDRGNIQSLEDYLGKKLIVFFYRFATIAFILVLRKYFDS